LRRAVYRLVGQRAAHQRRRDRADPVVVLQLESDSTTQGESSMTAMMALVGFAAWTLLLVFVAVSWRLVEILRGKPANSWGRGSAIEVPGFIRRAEHAHLNCLENLPIFAVIVLAAHALGGNAVVDALACWVLYARIGQSLVHLVGVRPALVLVRATFYFLQLALFVYMLWSLLA
jgi:uncharacterized MAPEG superfamily protein